MTPTRNGKPWKYCAKCGSQMSWRTSGDSYDRESGEYGPNFSWRCKYWEPGDRSKSHDIANTTVRNPKTDYLTQ